MDFYTFKILFQFDPVTEKSNSAPPRPLVSVCIQTYNQEKYISKCIESVLAQKTAFKFEILLADDDSNDATGDICKSYADKHGNIIRYFKHSRKNNISILGDKSATFISIYNFFSAKGKYIAICEGDDYWGDPLKLQKQFDFMSQNPEYSICYHSFQAVDSNGMTFLTDLVSPLKKSLDSKQLIFPWTHPSTLTIFFKNILNEIPKEATEVLTLDTFLYSLLGNYGPGKFLNNIAPSFYRLNDQGIWGKKDLEYKLLNKINTYKKISKYYERTNQPDASKVFNRRITKLKIYILYYKVRKKVFRSNRI